MLIDIFFIVLLTIFLILSTAILRGLKNVFDEEEFHADTEDLPNVSVIIAAKNEEQNIARLFEGLSGQDYPREKFEVIFVDDDSADQTFENADAASANLLSRKIIRPDSKKIAGKKGALTAGIAASSFEVILITDADCLPSEKWISSFAQKFLGGAELCFGIAPIKIQNDFNLPPFENLRSSILTFAAAGIGLPYSAASRSFGFSRGAFKKIDGYNNTIDTLGGDDDLLLREAVKHKMKIDTVVSSNALVYSNGKGSLKEYLAQKSRHVKTSLHYLPKHKFILGLWHSVNLVMLLSPLLMLISWKFIIPITIKLCFDLFTVKIYQSKFGYSFSFFGIITNQILYEIFLIINLFNALFRKDKWN